MPLNGMVIVDIVTSGYFIVTSWILVNLRSDCFMPGKVSFDMCAMTGVLFRGSFLKNVVKNASFFFGTLLQCV
jgi:hypothetical protein